MATYIHNLQDKNSLERCFPNWRNSSLADIKQEYKKKALELHPDKNPNGEAMFKQLAKWYTVLTNPTEKRILETEIHILTYNPSVFPIQHSADTRQTYPTYPTQSERTARQKQAEKEFDAKIRKQDSEVRSNSSGPPLKERLAEQQMELHYIAITDFIYEIKKQLNASGEDLSQVTATRLLNQIAQARVKIAAMLSDNYTHKNILIKKEDKKKSLENELSLELTTLEKDVQNKIKRSKPSNVQTTAPKVRRMHHSSSNSFFQKMDSKPVDKSDVDYKTHLQDLANDLLSTTPKKQYDASKRRKLDANRPGRLQEIEKDLQATDLDWQEDLLLNQQEQAQKVTLEDVEFRHPKSPQQTSNAANLEDVFEELLKVYTNTSTVQPRNPEQVKRLTTQAIDALRNMRANPNEQASWRRKRNTGGGRTTPR